MPELAKVELEDRFTQPRTTAGRLWFGQAIKNLGLWIQAGCNLGAPLEKAASCLRYMVEREPDCADVAVFFLVSILLPRQDQLTPGMTERLARQGLAAARLRLNDPDDPRTQVEKAVLQVALGRALMDQEKLFEAARILAAAEPGNSSHLALFMEAERCDLLARMAAATLDDTAMFVHARQAHHLTAEFRTPMTRLSSLIHDFILVAHRRTDVAAQDIGAIAAFLHRRLGIIQVPNSMRVLSALVRDPAAYAKHNAAEWRARVLAELNEVGPGRLCAWELRPLMTGAFWPDCTDRIKQIADAYRATGLTGVAVRPGLWAAVAADPAGPEEHVDLCLKLAGNFLEIEDAAERIVVLGWCVQAAARIRDAARLDEYLKIFPKAWRLASGEFTWETRLPIRRLLDPAIAILVERAGHSFANEPSTDLLGTIGELVDSNRSEPAGWPMVLMAGRQGTAMDDPDVAQALQDAETAAAALPRLAAALEARPDWLALVLQATPEGFVAISLAHRGGTRVHVADAACRQAWRALADTAEDQAADAFELRVPPDDEALERAGSAAYAAMPADLRARLAEHGTWIVCPDVAGGLDAVPLELLHDGAAWMGLSKIIARTPSVLIAAMVAEGRQRAQTAQRALVCAIAEPEDREALPRARAEAESIRGILSEANWDVPEIDERRIDEVFIPRRAPLVAHLHIAGHGEVSPAGEAVVLRGKRRLTTETIRSLAGGPMPTLFLNTCELARARYVGGGVVRGVAHAFLQAGAPTVIANLLRVDDEASSALTSDFYRAATGRPSCGTGPAGSGCSFGEALREARRASHARGLSPALWSATVLLGDPLATFAPAAELTDIEDVLSAEALKSRHDRAALHELTTRLDAIVASPQRVGRGLVLQSCRSLVGAFKAAETHQLADEPDLLCRACVLADLMQWPLLRGHAAFELAQLALALDRDTALRATGAALELLRRQEAALPGLRDLTDSLFAARAQLMRGDRPLRVDVRGPLAPEETKNTEAIGWALVRIQLAIEGRLAWYGLQLAERETEDLPEHVLWNAVMRAGGIQLDDAPETASFAHGVARRVLLTEWGMALPESTRTGLDRVLPTVLTGLLRWCWDRQNRVAAHTEMIEGQTATVWYAVEVIRDGVTEGKLSWLQPCEEARGFILALLAGLADLPYDERLFHAIQHCMLEITARVTSVIEDAKAAGPETGAAVTAYMLGMLVEVNSYSPLDGSVPEKIGERLTDIWARQDGDAEDALQPWLWSGFAEVRSRPIDELRRWISDFPQDREQP